MGDDIFFDRSNGYGMILDEYNGNYSISACKKNDKGLFKDWVFLSKWDQETRGWAPDEKKRPMGIYLGDREKAIKALRFFLRELGASDPGDPAADGSEDAIPF